MHIKGTNFADDILACVTMSLNCWMRNVLTLHAMVSSVVQVLRSGDCTRGSHIPVCVPCLLFAFLWQAKDIIALSSTLERQPPDAQWSTPGTRCSHARIIGEKLAEASLVTSPNSSLRSRPQPMPFWECVRVTLTLLTIGWRRGEMSSGCTKRRERPK